MPNTISEVESSVQQGLEAMRNVPFNEQIALTMRYLLPKGYRPVIQLEEEGRKKRSNAPADSWNPATGKISICFEPISSEQPVSTEGPIKPPTPDAAAKMPPVHLVPRFRPIPVRGEPASLTLLRDRGSY